MKLVKLVAVDKNEKVAGAYVYHIHNFVSVEVVDSTISLTLDNNGNYEHFQLPGVDLRLEILGD